MTPARAREVRRRVFLILGAAAVMVFIPHYRGPGGEWVHSYGSNLVVSFAALVWVQLLCARLRPSRWLTFALALGIVNGFEIGQGLGWLDGVFDPLDLVINTGGVVLGLVIDRRVVGALSNG